MNRRRFLRAAAAAGVPVALAGCTDGGDGSDGGDGDTSPTDTDEPTPTPTGADEPTPTDDGSTQTPTDAPDERDTDSPTESPTATGTPTPEPDMEVTVAPGGSLRFDPESFTISAGETVLWEWDSPNSSHNVSPESQPSDANWPGDDEDLYSAGHTYVYTFEVPGTYEYHCDPHQTSGMRGSFTVE